MLQAAQRSANPEHRTVKSGKGACAACRGGYSNNSCSPGGWCGDSGLAHVPRQRCGRGRAPGPGGFTWEAACRQTREGGSRGHWGSDADSHGKARGQGPNLKEQIASVWEALRETGSDQLVASSGRENHLSSCLCAC